MSATVIEPLPQGSIVFGFHPEIEIATADCECRIHKSTHTEPGECEHRAAYLLVGKNMFTLKSVIRMYLCFDCVEWHHEHCRKAHPLLAFTVTPLA